MDCAVPDRGESGMQRWIGLGVIANDLLVLGRAGHERLGTSDRRPSRNGWQGIQKEHSDPGHPLFPHPRPMSVVISAPESN